ncbi:zinc finger and BTB domain-containing protein 16, partial [Aphelenchoides avenae]
FYCSRCGTSFSEPTRLKEHSLRNHAKDLACTYDCCGFVGIDYKALEDHLVEVHGDLRVRTCSICDLWFSSRESLKAHLTSVHNGEYRYDCWCGYVTHCKSEYEAHEAKDDCTPKQ